MAGPYDGAEVLLWVNMAEPKNASSQIGATSSAIVVTLNNAGTNGVPGTNTNSIQFNVGTPAGTANVVAVTYSGGTTLITLTPASTGGAANAASAVIALNSAPAAKYYITASLPSGQNGSGLMVALSGGPLYIGAALAGTTVIQAGADTPTTDDFRPVTRQQGIDYSDTMDTIDAVSKGDRFALQLAGRQSGSFELSGLHSYELLRFRRYVPSTVYSSGGVASTFVQEANCRVTGFSISLPDSDVATFSAPISMQENWRVV
jgi:hypothetical protein